MGVYPIQNRARRHRSYGVTLSVPGFGPSFATNFGCHRVVVFGGTRPDLGAVFPILVTSSCVPMSYTVSGSMYAYFTVTCLQSPTQTLSRPRYVSVANTAQDRSAKRGHDSTYGRVCWELLACRKVHPFGFLRGRDRLPLLLGLFYAASCRKTRKNRDSILWSRR